MKTGRRLPLMILLAAGISVGITAVPSHAYGQDEAPYFERSACPIDIPDNPPIDCGTLTVPEDHNSPAGATIQLPVIIIHSRSANPASDNLASGPILFTEGGPGYSSLSSVWWLSRSVLVEDRDIIILEQRGNVYAKPSLVCDVSMWWLETESDSACLNRLHSQGIDLSHYTSQHIAADIEALRLALGIETWNLYGTSYSTRLMLLVMQDHPEGVRSVILDSVNPPHENRYLHDPEHTARVLKKMFDDCAADEACAAAYTDLESRFYRLFSRLNTNPVSFTIAYDAQGHRLEEPRTEEVDGYRLLGWMVTDAFYGPSNAGDRTSYLPLLIDQVEAGKTQLLYPWVMDEVFDNFWASPSFAWGLYFAVNCQNDFPLIKPDRLQTQAAAYPELEGYIRHAREIEICQSWNPPAAPLDSAPVKSDIPTLVLAGGYDPINPPEWGKSTADSLSHSYYYEFPAAGHGVAGESACALQLMTAFLNNPEIKPDGRCIENEPAAKFVLPQDVLIVPGFYHTIHDIDFGNPRGNPWLEAVAMSMLVLFSAEIVFLLTAGIVWLVRGRKRDTAPDWIARIAHPIAGLVAVLGLSVPILMSDINRNVLNSNPFLRNFGLPVSDSPAIYLGVVALVFTVLTVLLVIFAGAVWTKKIWSIPKRALFSMVTLAAAAFIPMLMRWGLITLLFAL